MPGIGGIEATRLAIKQNNKLAMVYAILGFVLVIAILISVCP